jgi:hypothetical protein
MAKKRRKKGGLLTSIRYSPKPKKKQQTLPRKVAGWIGGGLVLVALVGIAGLLIWRLVSPVEAGSGTFEVQRVEQLEEPEPSAADPGVEHVAQAFAEIEGREIFFKLTTEQLAEVEAGASIHADYKFYPLSRGLPVVVEEWELVEPGGSPTHGHD